MAIISRDLQQAAPRRLIGGGSWKPRPAFFERYVRLGLWIILAYAGSSLVTGWGRIWIDDLRYGRPRTHQITALVGHNEAAGEPSHFIAMNLNRRITVIELPGGDAAKAQSLQGPYLFGASEDLTPVRLRIQDIDADGKNDLIVSVKKEEIVYINTGENFRLINAEEREHLTEAR